MKHEDVWRALDTLAAENGLSASGLAKKAGLDPTTFNPSKRRMADGHLRWPSTESIAKVLNATGATLDGFSALVYGARAIPKGQRPLVGPRRVPKAVWWRLLELLLMAVLVFALGSALEARIGQRQPQGWEFYAAGVCLFITLGFPGFVWRYLRRGRG